MISPLLLVHYCRTFCSFGNSNYRKNHSLAMTRPGVGDEEGVVTGPSSLPPSSSNVEIFTRSLQDIKSYLTVQTWRKSLASLGLKWPDLQILLLSFSLDLVSREKSQTSFQNMLKSQRNKFHKNRKLDFKISAILSCSLRDFMFPLLKVARILDYLEIAERMLF